MREVMDTLFDPARIPLPHDMGVRGSYYGLMGIKCLACLALRIYNRNISVATQ